MTFPTHELPSSLLVSVKTFSTECRSIESKITLGSLVFDRNRFDSVRTIWRGSQNTTELATERREVADW